MSKRPFGHGDLRQMGNFKAVAADYEYYLTLLDEGRLYCLTDRQVYILLVQCEYIGWLTRWYNTEDINQNVVELIKSDVMEALMSCVDVSILIDQANLNLVDSVTSNQIQSQELRNILEDMYIPDDPTSINPSAPTTDFGASGDRYDALCSGLTAFVYGFARAQADSARAAQVGGLAAVALVAVLLIPGLNFFFVVGASIAVVLGMGTIGVSLEVAIASLTDTAALGNVICCMRDNLKDLEVTEANWLTCLGGCSFDVGSHEQIVADFLGACLEKNYLTILNILGQAYDGTINGDAMPECPCEAPPALIVLATTDWQVADVPPVAGYAVEDGIEYTITATGSTGGYGGTPPYDADGIPGSSQGGFPLSPVQSGALCGYIESSTDGDWFLIGTSHTFTADRTGTLRFAIADTAGGYANNTGELELSITP